MHFWIGPHLEGQRANRNALGPSPGLKAIKESILREKNNLIS